MWIRGLQFLRSFFSAGLTMACLIGIVTADEPRAALIDLSGPDFNPSDCPAWAKENLPAWLAPFEGKNGLPSAWKPRAMLASSVKGLDRYQANHFVYYCPKTADYLDRDYTSLAVGYKPGTLPAFERLAAKYGAGAKSDTAKAVALLQAMPQFFRHPTMPPLGESVKPDRNLLDEELLATDCGWCNEQARVFIRLCQVSGIPARMIHMFGQGHTVAEFYAEGRWAVADASNFFVVPAPNTKVEDGKLLSAADCHDRGPGQRAYAEAKRRRMQEMAAMSDAELGFKDAERARKWRERDTVIDVDELAAREIGFGVINYPLPK